MPEMKAQEWQTRQRNRPGNTVRIQPWTWQHGRQSRYHPSGERKIEPCHPGNQGGDHSKKKGGSTESKKTAICSSRKEVEIINIMLT